MKYKGFNIFLLLCFSALVLPAQNIDKVELIATFDKQFEYLDSLLNHQFTDFCSPLQEFEANTLSERINNIELHKRNTAIGSDNKEYSDWYVAFEDAVNRKTRAEISAIKNKTGLQWSNSYYNRTVPYRLYQFIDDDGDFSMVKVRYQTDLSWNLMDCGLLWGKSKIAASKISAEQTLTDAKINIQNNYIEELTAENVQRYQQTIALLRFLRLQNLSLLEQTETVLLENQQSSTDRLLGIMDELFLMEQTQATDMGSLQFLSGLAYQVIDTVALHTDLFLETVKSHNYELVKLDLSRDQIGTQIKQTSFWNNVTLSPFIRLGIYGMIGNERQGAIDMGVNLRIPLSFEQSKSRKALVADQQILASKRDLSYLFFQEEVCRLAQELSQINKKMIFEYRRIQEMRKLLLDRSEAFKALSGEYSRPGRIREYNRYITCLEAIVQLKYQRNVILIGLQRYLSGERIDSFIDYIQLS